MARRAKKAEPKPKRKPKSATTSQRKSEGKAQPKKRNAKSAMIVRRNTATARSRKGAAEEDSERTPLTERVQEMSGSHVVAGLVGGALGNVAGVLTVGKGWIGPKWTAGLLAGSGVSTMTAGWYWEWDHIMSAGAGLTAAGAFSMAHLLSVDAYEAMERKAEEKRKRKKEEEAEKERKKRVADARSLLEEEAQKQKTKKTRNAARRIIVLDSDGEPIDAEFYEPEAT